MRMHSVLSQIYSQETAWARVLLVVVIINRSETSVKILLWIIAIIFIIGLLTVTGVFNLIF